MTQVGPRSGGRRPAGSARRLCRLALGLGALTALTVTGVFAGTGAADAAGAAVADPVTEFAAVGDDTTAYFMDQFAIDVGNAELGSWDAFNPATGQLEDDISPKEGCTMTRPFDSISGLDALRISLNPGSAAERFSDPPEPGCVDFARSSLGPGSDQSDDGSLVYIPFALDAVATATGPATAVTGSDPAVATAITHADDFTLAQISDMYDNCAPQTVDGVTYDPTGATGTPIHLYIPDSSYGYDTRIYWAQMLGFDGNILPDCVHDRSVLDTTEVIKDHDGTIYAQDPDAFGPFEIPQWISQKNGHHDQRHNAALHSLSGTTPLTTSGTLNTAYPIQYEVYNIALYSAVSNGSGGPGTNADLSALLSGPTSRLCSDEFTIISYGFATLNGAPLGHTCGEISNDLRAFDPTSDPI